MANNSETVKLSLIRGSFKGCYIKLIYLPGTKYLNGLINIGEKCNVIPIDDKSDASEFKVVYVSDDYVKLLDNKTNKYLVLNDINFFQDKETNQLFIHRKTDNTFESAYTKNAFDTRVYLY